MAHTSGDWAFTPGKDNGMSTIHKKDDKTFVIGYVICEGTNKLQREEDLANAALMTAAPQMLDMLKRVRLAMDYPSNLNLRLVEQLDDTIAAATVPKK